VDDKQQTVQRPFEHKVFIRETKFSLPINRLNREELTIHDLYDAMIEDEQRNQMIIADVLNALNQNRSPVVLTERLSHLEKLVERLTPHVQNLLVLKGGMGIKQRRQIVEKLQSIGDDEERLIIATGRYLGEGFDDDRLDTLFLTLPISWRGTIIQYAGRLHRLHERKNEVLIFDYADLDITMLAKMHKRRLSGYRKIGYEIHDI
jgi:superfamily II DNA or RNA helicase